MIDVANLNRTFPKYPITVIDKGWIYGLWYCPTAWMKTHFVASADKLPFEDNSFSLYISDPPYSKADSKKYGCEPFPNTKAMKEAHRLLKPGGYYCLLNTRYPSFKRKNWNFVALIGVVTGANRCVRLLSIFQKPLPAAEINITPVLPI